MTGPGPAAHDAGRYSSGAYGPGEWPEVPLRPHERFPVLMTSGVWLVFLLWPLYTIIVGDAPVGLKVLGYVGLAAFVAAYLAHFLWPWPVQSVPHWANTAVLTVFLLLCVLAVSPSADLNSFNFLPFTLAVWIFPHRLGIGIPVALGLAAAWFTAGVLFGAGTGQWWLLLPTGLALLIMLALRLAMEREERSRVLGEELALSRQREQVGRDVHDVLGHSLTVITLKTELARRLVDTDPERARAELDEVLGISRQSLAEVRNTVGGLHVPELGAQLASARTALDAAGITARLPSPGTVSELPADRRELYAWCLREAVTNVIRHAEATHCTVTITADRLVVHDDGRGLPRTVARVPGTGTAAGPASDAWPVPVGSGSGLRGMRHRVTEAGGLLSVRPALRAGDRPGTIVEVVL